LSGKSTTKEELSRIVPALATSSSCSVNKSSIGWKTLWHKTHAILVGRDRYVVVKIHTIVSRFQAAYETSWKACRLAWAYNNFFFMSAHAHATHRNVDVVKLLSFCFSNLLIYGQAYQKP
jgi:hypothetical protein